MHDLKLGDALNDNLIERFWSIIMALTPGAAGASGSGSAASTGALHMTIIGQPPEGGSLQRQTKQTRKAHANLHQLCQAEGFHRNKPGKPGKEKGKWKQGPDHARRVRWACSSVDARGWAPTEMRQGKEFGKTEFEGAAGG
jgi:hypothetical protein